MKRRIWGLSREQGWIKKTGMNALQSIVELRRTLCARPGRALPSSSGPHRSYAAVAAVLRDTSSGVEVLLIRRAEHPGDPWSGHMALPGGRQDPDDPDLLHTAMRETSEELGLVLDPSQVIGPLDDLEAVARGRRVGMVVRPFVFHWSAPEPPELPELPLPVPVPPEPPVPPESLNWTTT